MINHYVFSLSLFVQLYMAILGVILVLVLYSTGWRQNSDCNRFIQFRRRLTTRQQKYVINFLLNTSDHSAKKASYFSANFFQCKHDQLFLVLQGKILTEQLLINILLSYWSFLVGRFKVFILIITLCVFENRLLLIKENVLVSSAKKVCYFFQSTIVLVVELVHI